MAECPPSVPVRSQERNRCWRADERVSADVVPAGVAGTGPGDVVARAGAVPAHVTAPVGGSPRAMEVRRFGWARVSAVPRTAVRPRGSDPNVPIRACGAAVPEGADGRRPTATAGSRPVRTAPRRASRCLGGRSRPVAGGPTASHRECVPAVADAAEQAAAVVGHVLIRPVQAGPAVDGVRWTGSDRHRRRPRAWPYGETRKACRGPVRALACAAASTDVLIRSPRTIAVRRYVGRASRRR
ncbi:hypothetical protein SAMN02982918_3052 [Saccharomonospora viridis]|uniref:Uncharacterized protein n=1 Tax=Saccharomonospora viridis TaxID=1852 RepID=A0A837DF56_9PSEU|nr:hypothetical protein MINT15_13780 [Saccharomonospora viridis]SFP65914.1 hypothetical protein SAMN02982918_3052 [Saccharomonospora viridis]